VGKGALLHAVPTRAAKRGHAPPSRRFAHPTSWDNPELRGDEYVLDETPSLRAEGEAIS
jgi:hypothetical protein